MMSERNRSVAFGLLAAICLGLALPLDFIATAGAQTAPAPPAAQPAPPKGAPSVAPRRIPPRSLCRVGRRFYCDKYLGRCRTHGGPDCDAWYEGCVACHDHTAECNQGLRYDSTECQVCQQTFSACMKANYKAHWPELYSELYDTQKSGD